MLTYKFHFTHYLLPGTGETRIMENNRLRRCKVAECDDDGCRMVVGDGGGGEGEAKEGWREMLSGVRFVTVSSEGM